MFSMGSAGAESVTTIKGTPGNQKDAALNLSRALAP
jgi:hypothetical protein